MAVAALWMLHVFPLDQAPSSDVRQSAGAVLAGTAALIAHESRAVLVGFGAFIRAIRQDLQWRHDPSWKDRLIQRRLIKEDLFLEPKIIDGKPIRMALFGFDDRPWTKYIEIADVLLEGEKGLRKKGFLSPEESEKLQRVLDAREIYKKQFDGVALRRKEDRRNEYVHFVQHVRQILLRNPYSVLGSDESDRVVSITFCSIGFADSSKDLPSTWIGQSFWHLRNWRKKSRNALVDFWFTGLTPNQAEYTLKATFELARAINALGISEIEIAKDNIYAYSNLRTLWMHPDMSAEELVQRVTGVQLGSINYIEAMGETIVIEEDPAISRHFGRDAVPVEIKHDAFPSIFPDKPKSGIGRRDAVIMRYPFDPGPKLKPRPQDRRRSQRMRYAASLLIAA